MSSCFTSSASSLHELFAFFHLLFYLIPLLFVPSFFSCFLLLLDSFIFFSLIAYSVNLNFTCTHSSFTHLLVCYLLSFLSLYLLIFLHSLCLNIISRSSSDRDSALHLRIALWLHLDLIHVIMLTEYRCVCVCACVCAWEKQCMCVLPHDKWTGKVLKVVKRKGQTDFYWLMFIFLIRK